MTTKGTRTSAAIAGCARVPQQPRQSLDRVPAPAGKTRRHDRRPPQFDWLRPGEAHTGLLKKHRKLPCQAFGLRLEHGIRLAKDSLATPPQFPVKPRSQPLRRPGSVEKLTHGRRDRNWGGHSL